MSFAKHTTILLQAAFFVVETLAPTAFSQELPFQHYTMNDGLLSNGVVQLYQDSRGYLFVSSAEGLSIFDGTSFTHYRTKDGLPSNFVNCVYEQSSSPGVMWIGTNNGLARLTSNRLTQILVDTTLRSLLVHSIFVDITGTVWCGTLGGLYTIRGDSIKKVKLGIDLVSEIKVAGASPDSVLWVVVGNVLFSFGISGELVHRVPLSNSKLNHFTDALADKYGNVWVGLRDSTLCLFQNGVLVARRRMPAGRVHHLMVDQGKELYIGTDDGLLITDIDRFGRSDFDRITTANGLASNFVNGGLIDKENNLWLLFRDAGIAMLKTRGVWTFPLPDIHAAYNNARAACDSAGHFWVTSGDSLVEIQRVGRSNWLVTKHDVGTTASTGQPIGVVYDSEHRLWVSFREAWLQAYDLRPQRGKKSTTSLTRTLKTGIPDFYFTFFIDRRDRLWCQQRQGIAMIDHRRNKVLRMYTTADGITDIDARTMYEDRQGRIWLGLFTDGIAVVNGYGATPPLGTFTAGRNLPAGFIRALCEDNDGRMWVGTRHGGCAVLDGDSVHLLSTKNVLPSDAVWSIAKDEQGMMWLGTTLGLVAVDPVTRRPIPMGNDIVRDPVLALGVSPRNEIWFVTSDAFGIIDRNSLYEPPKPPAVRVDRMEVDEQRIDFAEPLELPYDRNNCTFGFLSVSFRGTREIRYQYRLLGLDGDWQQPTSQRSVTYASLKPGTYRFEVRATRVGTPLYGEPAAISFAVAPPFWLTWWFSSASILSTVSMLLFFYRRRVSGLEKEKRTQQEFSARLMESQENERKRIAGELHDSLGQNLLVIRNRALLGLKDHAISEQARNQLDQISSVATQAINEVREIAYDLRPYQLDRLGLTKAITSITSELVTSVQFSMNVDHIDGEVEKDLAIHVYRIVQEGINNILKHADATEAQVVIRVEPGNLRITISDNGKGMPRGSPGAADDRHAHQLNESNRRQDRQGFGLVGITERAKVLKGTVEVEAVPGKGTTLTLVIPRSGRGHQNKHKE